MTTSPTEAKTPNARKLTTADSSTAVDAFMATLVHAHKPAIEALRRLIRETDASIGEGVKWNAPSYRTSEYFATTHLHDRNGVGLILHLGARKRDIGAVPIDDPTKLLNWLAKDRAQISFTGLADVQTHAKALQSIVRQWIGFV